MLKCKNVVISLQSWYPFSLMGVSPRCGDVFCPAALKANIKITSRFPPDPGRNRPKALDLLRKMSVRTLPRTPGGTGNKNKIKSVLKYSWILVSKGRHKGAV